MSLNDPQWGNRGNKGGNQGPPDLEELWRDFNRRLSGLFGRRGGGGGDEGGGGGGVRPPQLSFRQFGGGIGLLVMLVIVIWLASGFYIVDASQRGVVLQFGRFKETTDPGLRWRLPYPIQSHELVNLTGVRTVEIGYRGSERNKVLKEALMLTDDENIINIQFAVQYVLKDPQQFLFNNRLPDEAVVQVAETAVREIVGKSRMDFVLYEGREEIAVDASKLMQEILDRYQTGIQISKVTMQNAQPPEQVQGAFDDAVKAGQDRERQKNEGQAYANDVIPKARGTASRLFEEANGYNQRVVANAEGDASRFKQILVEYSKAPEVTRQRMYLDTVQQVMSNTSKIMIDARANNNLLFLPLDKLMQASGGGAAATAAGSGTSAPAETVGQGRSAAAETAVAPPKADVPTVPEYRSRDSLRSRERVDR
jgi:membrane protease subunit HflK